ncbi:unnamed protein product [Rhizophagus irregularis]|nr:unnamed protein product [Rhizophagus irregularis]
MKGKGLGGLPTNGKPRFVSFGWTSEEGKPRNQDSSFRWTSEEGKPRNQDLFRVGSDGLLKNGKQRTKTQRFVNMSSGGLPKNENQKIKIHKIGWASDLWEKRNQDS